MSNPDILRRSHENPACQNLCDLAISARSSTSIFSTYIVGLTNMQKRQGHVLTSPLMSQNDLI